MMHESSILMMNLGEVLKLRKLDWRNGNKFCIKETGYEKMTRLKGLSVLKAVQRVSILRNHDCLMPS